MIGLLRGIVEYREDPHILLSVGGVGYRVLASHDVLHNIDGIGKEITVFTHTHVREDVLELYGFSSRGDLKLFELLIGVSGIGPKTAIGIFTIGSSSQIQEAITRADVDFFVSVPRLGRKNAQKIIIELKNRLGSIGDIDLSGDRIEKGEVVSALKAFGFTPKEAQEAVRAISGQGQTTEEKVKLALKYLGK